MSISPQEEAIARSTSPATPPYTTAELEALQRQLLERTNERIERSHQIQQTLDLINGLTGGVPAPYSFMVNQAAAPTLNQQEAELRGVQADIVLLMQQTREIAAKVKEHQEAEKAAQASSQQEASNNEPITAADVAEAVEARKTRDTAVLGEFKPPRIASVFID